MTSLTLGSTVSGRRVPWLDTLPVGVLTPACCFRMGACPELLASNEEESHCRKNERSRKKGITTVLRPMSYYTATSLI